MFFEMKFNRKLKVFLRTNTTNYIETSVIISCYRMEYELQYQKIFFIV